MTTHCLRCGRTLTSAQSITNGMGRTCRSRVRQAADVIDLTAFRDAKAARTKATDLIEQAGIVPASRPGLYLAVSSDGANTYLIDTAEASCTCKGYAKVGRCYHQVAAGLLGRAA